MQLWAGLGNPGTRYEKTRHNAGVMILEELFPSISPQNEKKLKGLVAKVGAPALVLLFPQTFMNLSGDSVAPAMNFYKITPSDLVVFHDEIELAPGEVAYKFGGGHKGHNGLRDIIAKTGSAEFHRIRIGVGRPPHPDQSVADYVLSKMPSQELAPAEKVRKLLIEKGLLEPV